MRILVAALGSPGHAFPLVPLALALRDAGHDVTFAVGGEVRDAIAGSGLEVVVAGIGMGEAFGPILARRGLTERPTDQTVMASIAGEAFGSVLPRTTAADLVPWITEHRPDLVVAEVGDPGAALAALRCDVPCVTHAFGRRSAPDSPMVVGLQGHLAGVAAEIGVAVPPAFPLGHTYLDICPRSMQLPAPDGAGRELPLRPTAWNPPVDFHPRPRSSGRPWVYLTLGTAMGNAGVLRTAVEGLARLDVDVLLAAGSVDVTELSDLAALGDHVQVEPFVPQADLLDSFALVVHHGGSGTTIGSAAAGVPQLFLPQGADQFTNAATVTELVAGRSLIGPGQVTADAVAEAARTLLEDEAPPAAARALAAEVATMPSPAEVAARVEQWARP